MLGKFTSVDPVVDPKLPQQNTGYAYSGNNPSTFSDPTGLRLDDPGPYPPATKAQMVTNALSTWTASPAVPSSIALPVISWGAPIAVAAPTSAGDEADSKNPAILIV